MNLVMIRRLILKDWYLHRLAICLLLGGAVLGGALVLIGGSTGFSIGFSLIMSVLIALTFYLPLSSVIGERTDKTLPFVMSLPVSPAQYTAAKILANLVLYLIPWGVALTFTALVPSGPLSGAGIPQGYVPVLLIGFLVLFMLILGFAIIFESMGWTVTLIVILMFLLGNVATLLVPKIPGAREFLAGVGQRGPEFYGTLAGEIAVIGLLMALTFYVQSRKRDFL